MVANDRLEIQQTRFNHARTGQTPLVVAVVVATLLSMAAFAAVAFGGGGSNEQLPSLRVKELVIVDDAGTIRLRLTADAPDAVVNGRRIPRGEKAAGIILYDDMGRERGGYVTLSPSRNVLLTLDTQERQVALFAADPKDGAVARLWSGGDWIEMRSDAGGSHLSIGRDNALVVQQPTMSASERSAACMGLKEELAKLNPKPASESVLSACKQRMTEAACRECLELP